MRRARLCCVQRKCPRMREAVEHAQTRRNAADRLPVILLIEEKPRLLSVDVIHVVADAVFRDLRMSGKLGRKSASRIEALALFQSLALSQSGLVSLIERTDRLTVLAQQPHERIEEHLLALLHAEREHLRHENVREAIHREPGEHVRLAEDQPAATVVRAHDLPAVVQRIAKAPLEKRCVKAVVGIARDDPYADLAVAVIEAGAEVLALIGKHIHKRAVRNVCICARDLALEHPRVSAAQGALALFRDLNGAVIPFHTVIAPCCRAHKARMITFFAFRYISYHNSVRAATPLGRYVPFLRRRKGTLSILEEKKLKALRDRRPFVEDAFPYLLHHGRKTDGSYVNRPFGAACWRKQRQRRCAPLPQSISFCLFFSPER